MIALTLAAAITSGFALKDGDRVVFYGDSITEGAFYSNHAEAAILCRFPGLKVEFFNVGWAGDTSWGQYGWDGAGGSSEDRVRRDVAPLSPTHVSIMLGMNDSGYVPYETKIEKTFQEFYGKLVGWLAGLPNKPAMTLIRSSPWDDYTRPPSFVAGIKGEGGYNAVIARYGEYVRTLAESKGYRYVDFNATLATYLARAAELDPELAHSFIPDNIHPGPPAGLMMAGELLKGWGLDALVCNARLDAAQKKILSQENTVVKDFDGLSWTQTDRSLPFPIDLSDMAMRLALRASDLNQVRVFQRLFVENLKSGRYRLEIDGKKVLETTAEECAKGVFLANYQTPMLDQALEVHRLTVKKNRAFFVKWREIEFPNPGSASARTAAVGIEKLRLELLKKQRAAAQPKPHRFELKPL